MLACRLGQQAFHGPGTQADYPNLIAIARKVVGKLAADQTVAQNGHSAHAIKALAERLVILQVVDTEQCLGAALDRQPHGRSTTG
ncbi:hypothetical protein D9M73_258500 [compost metagenome]